MSIHKILTKNIIRFSPVVLVYSYVAIVLLVGHALAAAASPPGCYQQIEGTTNYTLNNDACAGQNDSNFNPIDSNANCYLQILLGPGVAGPPGAYKIVDCASIDSTKVNSGCVSKTCLPQDPCYTATPATTSGVNTCQSNKAFRDYLDAALNFLAIGVGVLIVIMITVGGIQYITAGGDPQGVATAKKRITNALIALLAFIFMYAFLQFIIPGGIFP